MFLIDDLVAASLKGVMKVAKIIHEQVLQETQSEDYVRRQLVELRLAFEMEEVDAASYAEQEAGLLARLREIRLARLQRTGGGPDRVTDS